MYVPPYPARTTTGSSGRIIDIKHKVSGAPLKGNSKQEVREKERTFGKRKGGRGWGEGERRYE